MIIFKHDGFNWNVDYEKLNGLKNILVVGGDSWSNMLYGIDDSSVNVTYDNWVNIFSKRMGYDAVILCSGNGDSNEIIFSNLVDVLSNLGCKHRSSLQANRNNWMSMYELKNYNVNVIIEWSSIIRDFSINTAWYRPFSTATQPDWNNIDESMYNEYILQIYNDKIYSHKTQYYSWQLQKYFEKWNIPYYFWMGFCNLVPTNVKNTEFDIRHLLNKDNWFNLYETPGNMLDYLTYLENKIIPEELPTLVTEGSIFTLQKGTHIINKLYKNNILRVKNGLLQYDMHPTEDGHKVISEIIYNEWLRLYKK